jgi:hypothetical protein
MSRRVSRSTTVDAPAAAVFALLTDPSEHGGLDGSGTVEGIAGSPRRLGPGSRFRMRMRLGVPYSVTNEVVEFRQDRRIAWRHWGRHVWRWELEPAGSSTRVTETFDWSAALAPRALEVLRVPQRNTRSIEATLRRLQARFGVGR